MNQYVLMLCTSIIGFVFGISFLSMYIGLGDDAGSWAEWIGSLATIVAGIWAYKRFSVSRQERFEVTEPRIELRTREAESKENDNGIVNSYQIKIANLIERPTSIVRTGFYYFLVNEEPKVGNQVFSKEFKFMTKNNRLEFDDYVIAEFSIVYIYNYLDAARMIGKIKESDKELKAVPFVEFAAFKTPILFLDKSSVINLEGLKIQAEEIVQQEKILENLNEQFKNR